MQGPVTVFVQAIKNPTQSGTKILKIGNIVIIILKKKMDVGNCGPVKRDLKTIRKEWDHLWAWRI